MSRPQNFTGAVRAFIEARPGQYFQAHQLAKQFDTDTKNVRNALTGLMRQQSGIRETIIMGKRSWYYPSEEQLAAMNAPAPVREVRPFRPYKVPQAMAELAARVTAHREAFPSHYGPGKVAA